MTDRIVQNVDLPGYISVLKTWTSEAHKAALAAANLIDFTEYFIDREIYDCRVKKRNEDTDQLEPTGDYYTSPLRHTLMFGSEVDREKGFFILDGPSPDDGTAWSPIRGYAMTHDILRDIPIPSNTTWVEGYHVSCDPRQMAYDTLVATLKLGTCEQIYVLTGNSGPEKAMFCFPLRCKKNGSYWLIVTVDSRYHDMHAHLFDGDPKLYAKSNPRKPRKEELDAFFENRMGWNPPEVPAQLDINGDGPISFELKDVLRAVRVMKSDGGPYLWSGGA